MRIVRTVVMLVVTLGIACPVMAAEKKQEKKAPPCPAGQICKFLTKSLTLTDDQKAKLADVCKEFGPKLVEAHKGTEVLTPEQKAAQAAALKAAQEAVKLTADQKAKVVAARKQIAALEKELHEKILSVLTAEQKEQLKPAKKTKTN